MLKYYRATKLLLQKWHFDEFQAGLSWTHGLHFLKNAGLNLRGPVCFWQIYLGSCQPQTAKLSWTSQKPARYLVQRFFVNIDFIVKISNIPRFLYIISKRCFISFLFFFFFPTVLLLCPFLRETIFWGLCLHSFLVKWINLMVLKLQYAWESTKVVKTKDPQTLPLEILI